MPKLIKLDQTTYIKATRIERVILKNRGARAFKDSTASVWVWYSTSNPIEDEEEAHIEYFKTLTKAQTYMDNILEQMKD